MADKPLAIPAIDKASGERGTVYMKAGLSHEDLVARLLEQGLSIDDGSTPEGNVGQGAAALAAEESSINQGGLMQGLRDMGNAVSNTAMRPFRTTQEHSDQLVDNALRTKATMRKLEQRTVNLQNVGGGASPNGYRMVPRVGLEAGLGAMLPGTSVRSMTRIAGEMGIGAAVEGLYSTDQSMRGMLVNGGVGALGSGLFAAAAELPAATRAFLTPELIDGLRKQGALSTRFDPFMTAEDSRRTGIEMTPQEHLQSSERLRRTYGNIDRSALGPRETFQMRRAGQVEALFGNMADRLLPAGLVPNMPIARVQGALREASTVFTDSVNQLRDQAGAAFTRELAPAIQAADAVVDTSGRILGGAPLMPRRRFIDELYSQRNAASEAGATPATLARMDAELGRLTRGSGANGWTLGGFQEKLSEIGRNLADRQGASVRSILDSGASFDERRMRAAMMQDLEDGILATGRHQNTQPVAAALRNAREAYRTGMERVNFLEDTAVDNLLGGGRPFTGDEFTARFMGLQPDAQLATMQFLESTGQRGAEAADGLRGVMFRTFVQRHAGRQPNPNPDRPAQFELGGFVTDLGNLHRSTRDAMLPALRPADRVRMEAGLNIMGRLVNSPNASMLAGNGLTTKSLLQRLDAAAINVVLRNPGFVARFLSGEFMPHHLERMLYTPDGVRSFMALGDPKRTRAATVNAVGSLLNQYLHTEAEVQAIKDAATDAQAEAELRARAQAGGQP